MELKSYLIFHKPVFHHVYSKDSTYPVGDFVTFKRPEQVMTYTKISENVSW